MGGGLPQTLCPTRGTHSNAGCGHWGGSPLCPGAAADPPGTPWADKGGRCPREGSRSFYWRGGTGGTKVTPPSWQEGWGWRERDRGEMGGFPRWFLTQQDRGCRGEGVEGSGGGSHPACPPLTWAKAVVALLVGGLRVLQQQADRVDQLGGQHPLLATQSPPDLSPTPWDPQHPHIALGPPAPPHSCPPPSPASHCHPWTPLTPRRSQYPSVTTMVTPG